MALPVQLLLVGEATQVADVSEDLTCFVDVVTFQVPGRAASDRPTQLVDDVFIAVGFVLRKDFGPEERRRNLER